MHLLDIRIMYTSLYVGGGGSTYTRRLGGNDAILQVNDDEPLIDEDSRSL